MKTEDFVIGGGVIDNSKEKQTIVNKTQLMGKTGKSSLTSNLLLGSQGAGLESDGVDLNDGLILFTHQKKRKMEGSASLIHDYENLRVAVLELYLSIKIRSDEEISEYNKDSYEQEKNSMKGVDGYNLIDLIKKTIE